MQQFRDPSVVRKVSMILSLTLGIRTSRPASLLLKGIMGSTVKRSTSPASFPSRRSKFTVLACGVFLVHPSGGLGGLRAFGKTCDEAFELFQRFRRLEEAGAFSVEAEVIPGKVMGEIS